MDSFKTHTGLVGILNRGNIDTDQIIPKDFLKSIKRTGYGEHLFEDWRYLPDGKPNPDFELNSPRFKDASILITGNNFGCGSSREHAVWAVVQAGFKVVIAPKKKNGNDTLPGFADIFRNNSTKNGLLLIELSEKEVENMISLVNANQGLKATVDLQSQKITFPSQEFSFSIDPGVKQYFLEGLDEIGQSLRFEADITRFEKTHSAQINI